MTDEARFKNAMNAFDQYNSEDPNKEIEDKEEIPKELLYAQRMTKQLLKYIPDSPDYLQLAARSQHIGRWEIARANYPMDKKGYFQWRNKLKEHHAAIAEPILKGCGYDELTIEKVKFLLLKKELTNNPDTQALEDVICLVFLEYYIDEFAAKHNDEKVIDILRKTIKKMSEKAIHSVAEIPLSDKIKSMIDEAVKS
ncbi:MAG: DUF4202 domain-containing protein [Bacteroidetes bacterium]|nr:DUF4202 domain-containing protein [Bacteroidota bacterium]